MVMKPMGESGPEGVLVIVITGPQHLLTGHCPLRRQELVDLWVLRDGPNMLCLGAASESAAQSPMVERLWAWQYCTKPTVLEPLPLMAARQRKELWQLALPVSRGMCTLAFHKPSG